MQGLKVLCPSCRRTKFETTDQYNPDIRAHGGMVKWLGLYQIDWLCSSTTLCSEMTCPDCQAQLAPSGRLTVLSKSVEKRVAAQSESPTPEPDIAMEESGVDEVVTLKQDTPKFFCQICGDGREFKNQMALSAHNRHKHKPAQ